MVFVYTNLRSLQKLRDGTGRTTSVERTWLEEEIEEWFYTYI